jgi:hypothetical protein
MNDGDELSRVISELYDKNRGVKEVSPAWLATEAMAKIGFPHSLHRIGYIGCHLQFRQIARSFCRSRFERIDLDGTEGGLFPETLQERYPVRPKSDEEPRYVLLEFLEDGDIAYNVDRMLSASEALRKHAAALEAWRRERFGSAARSGR